MLESYPSRRLSSAAGSQQRRVYIAIAVLALLVFVPAVLRWGHNAVCPAYVAVCTPFWTVLMNALPGCCPFPPHSEPPSLRVGLMDRPAAKSCAAAPQWSRPGVPATVRCGAAATARVGRVFAAPDPQHFVGRPRLPRRARVPSACASQSAWDAEGSARAGG